MDEIGDLPPGLQVKLLRVLEENQITRLGETHPRKVAVQILSSTNKDLAESCHSGRFRVDLYYRLSSAKIHIPPLRRTNGGYFAAGRLFPKGGLFKIS